MIKQIIDLLEKEQYDKEMISLIYTVLEHEQRYISFELNTSSSKLKEIKQKIREEIDSLSKNGYEV